MVGILFTTTDAATTFANDYADGRVDPLEEGTPVRVDDTMTVATGPGKINAALTTERLLVGHGVDALVHVGPCAARSESLDHGTLVGMTSVLEGDRVALDNPAYPQMPLSDPDTTAEGVLVTQDHIRADNDEPGYWARLADVQDDTGYAVAYVAAHHGRPCYIAKVVTAHAPDALSSLSADAVHQTLTPFLRSTVERLS